MWRYIAYRTYYPPVIILSVGMGRLRQCAMYNGYWPLSVVDWEQWMFVWSTYYRYLLTITVLSVICYWNIYLILITISKIRVPITMDTYPIFISVCKFCMPCRQAGRVGWGELSGGFFQFPPRVKLGETCEKRCKAINISIELVHQYMLLSNKFIK